MPEEKNKHQELTKEDITEGVQGILYLIVGIVLLVSVLF